MYAIRSYYVHLCTSADGTRLAYATTGEGYPLVRAGHWLTHLDFDWHSPIWRPILLELGKNFRVTRYDQRVITSYSIHYTKLYEASAP